MIELTVNKSSEIVGQIRVRVVSRWYRDLSSTSDLRELVDVLCQEVADRFFSGKRKGPPKDIFTVDVSSPPQWVGPDMMVTIELYLYDKGNPTVDNHRLDLISDALKRHFSADHRGRVIKLALEYRTEVPRVICVL